MIANSCSLATLKPGIVLGAKISLAFVMMAFGGVNRLVHVAKYERRPPKGNRHEFALNVRRETRASEVRRLDATADAYRTRFADLVNRYSVRVRVWPLTVVACKSSSAMTSSAAVTSLRPGACCCDNTSR